MKCKTFVKVRRDKTGGGGGDNSPFKPLDRSEWTKVPQCPFVLKKKLQYGISEGNRSLPDDERVSDVSIVPVKLGHPICNGRRPNGGKGNAEECDGLGKQRYSIER